MYAACSASRFMRRPSPKRSAFSKVRARRTSADRVPRLRALLQRRRPRPPRASPSSRVARTTYSAPTASPARSSAGARAERRPAVDRSVAPVPRHDELGFVAVEAGRADDRDPRRGDGPGLAARDGRPPPGRAARAAPRPRLRAARAHRRARPPRRRASRRAARRSARCRRAAPGASRSRRHPSGARAARRGSPARRAARRPSRAALRSGPAVSAR